MGTVTIRNNKEMDLVNSYMSSLVHLTDRMKVELINRLSASLLSEKRGILPLLVWRFSLNFKVVGVEQSL